MGLSPSFMIMIIIIIVVAVIAAVAVISITTTINVTILLLVVITGFARKMFPTSQRVTPVMGECWFGWYFPRALGWRRAVGLTWHGKCDGAGLTLCSKLILASPQLPTS